MNHLGLAKINLQHSKVAFANLRRLLATMHTKIFLIQEPYYHLGIKGLDTSWGYIHSVNGSNRSRACVYSRKDLNAMMLPQFSNEDMVSVQIKADRTQGTLRFICCSLYLPFDGIIAPDILTRLIKFCSESNIPLLIGCDANSHHTIWGRLWKVL